MSAGSRALHQQGIGGNVVIMGDGLMPIGKLTDSPPYPTIMRALYFYLDSLAHWPYLPDG